MKKCFIIAVASIFLNTLLYCQTNKLDQQIIQLSERKFEWLINKNYDSLNTILDERLNYVHSNGWIQTKKDIIDDLKNGKIEYQQVSTTEATVRFYDNTAILIANGKFTGLINNTPFALNLIFTEIYIKNGNKWLLVSRHANKI